LNEIKSIKFIFQTKAQKTFFLSKKTFLGNFNKNIYINELQKTKYLILKFGKGFTKKVNNM